MLKLAHLWNYSGITNAGTMKGNDIFGAYDNVMK